MHNSGNPKRGLTLLEVLIAVALLSLGLVVMLTAISRCLAVLKASTGYHRAMWALSVGEAENPIVLTDKGDFAPEDFEVSPVDLGGVTFERTVEDPDADADDSEVRLLVVKMKLTWSAYGKQKTEEVPRYIVFRE
jgi:prepilin-type N-terminal cleavage/methylation domain-containing protein